MLRLPPSRIHLTQREITSFTPKQNKPNAHITSPSPFGHVSGYRSSENDNYQLNAAPRLQRGPSRSRDASVVHRPIRRHQAFSVASTESYATLSELSDSSYDARYMTDDLEQFPHVGLENVAETAAFEHTELLHSHDDDNIHEVHSQDNSQWPSFLSRPEASETVDERHDRNQLDAFNVLEKPVENIQRHHILGSFSLPYTRHRSQSEPAENCVPRSGVSRPTVVPHGCLSELPYELLNSRHEMSRPILTVDHEHFSSDSHPASLLAHPHPRLRRRGLEFSTPSPIHRNGHGRHESLPVITASFSSPIHGSQPSYRGRYHRDSSDFSVLGMLEHNQSPLEELIHEVRSRLHHMGISESRTRDHSSEARTFDAPFEVPSLTGLPSSPMLGTMALPSPPLLNAPTNRRPSDNFLEDVEEDMMRGIRQRLASRPGAPLTRYRSRTPVWQPGAAAVATEDVIRSGQLRRARPAVEQENEDDMMAIFAEQRRVYVERHAHGGGVLERTPPREGHLERRQH